MRVPIKKNKFNKKIFIIFTNKINLWRSRKLRKKFRNNLIILYNNQSL